MSKSYSFYRSRSTCSVLLTVLLFLWIQLLLPGEFAVGLIWAQTMDNIGSKNDVIVYISPTKTILAQSSERILNSTEWTDFYLSKISDLDQRYLRNENATVLMRQLEKTFTTTPPTFNDLLDALFGYCSGCWLTFDLQSETLALSTQNMAIAFVTEFSDIQTQRLVSAFLNDFGFPEMNVQPNNHWIFLKDQIPCWFLQKMTFDEENKKNIFLLTDKEQNNIDLQNIFQTSQTVKFQLSEQDRIFLFIRLNSSFMSKVNLFFTHCSSDSLWAPFAPGMIELTQKVQSVSIFFREENGTMIATFSLNTDKKETIFELADLLEQLRNLLDLWAKDKEITPIQSLGMTILNQIEVSSDDLRFNLVFKLTDENIFPLIQKCFAQDKKP